MTIDDTVTLHPLPMPLYHVDSKRFAAIPETTFAREGVLERGDLQRLLRDQIGVLEEGLMVLAEEFGNWEESRRRIDLLCLDRQANLVVVELKRTEDGGTSDLQGIRYAAMVSQMKFDQAVKQHASWREERGLEGDAREALLDFLGWTEPREDSFGGTVRILLASSDFSRELTTTVLWLREQEIDVRCIRIKPYRFDGKVLVDVETIIPLKEAEDYLERIRNKEQAEREYRTSYRDFTRFDVTVRGVLHENLPKNRAMLQVARGLIDSGIHPEEITKALGWSRPLFMSFDGAHNEVSFGAEMSKDSRAGTDPYRRWFAREDELIPHGGRTYALWSNWGGQKTIDLLFMLAARWPECGVQVCKHPENADNEAA